MVHILKFRFRRAAKEAKPTFFFHIPKCAGSTIWEVIWDIYGTRNVFQAKSRAQHAKLGAMPLEKRLAYSAIGGHGTLRFFRQMLGSMEGYHKIVTLRDPIDRVISEFNYIRTRPQHRLNALVADQSVEEFIEKTTQPNRQVKLLARRPDDLDGAVETVRRFFDDWSLSNNVDEIIRRLYEITGVSERPAKHKNRATSSLKRSDLAPATLRLLEDRNRFDLALIDKLKGGGLKGSRATP